jgi:predicted AlkP superfamily pyrophosphatase or phosphodiesterase
MLMKRVLAALLVVLAGLCHAQQPDETPPKLIVLIGLDQFRAGYLERYNEAFSGGFRRLINEGVWYQNAIVDHAPTLSLPGHTTLATGTNPRTHGITSNAWIDPRQKPADNGKLIATIPHLDPGVHTLGDKTVRAFSPHKIRVDGLADWVRQANPGSRTVALSVSGLAVLYGGRSAQHRSDNHVYWLGSTGKFLTSSYYRDNYPDWINRFNEGMADKYVKQHVWDNTVPEKFRSLARQDKVDYEFDGVHTSFPHTADELTKETNQKHYNWWFGRFSPYQNDALFDLAKESIHQLELGQRDPVDLLSIAVKLTDRIGHDFGPRSLEQLDVILRLDRLLGEFLHYLDNTVGKHNYVIAVSADHGAPNISEYEKANGREALRISSEDFEEALKSTASLIRDHGDDQQNLPALIAENLEQFPFVSKAMSREDLDVNESNDAVIAAYQNSYLADQPTTYPLWTRDNMYGNLVSPLHPANYGVIVELTGKANIWPAQSTHGSSYQYDREVPILFMGNGIKARTAMETVFTRDIAPTLARLSGVDYPETVEGRPLDLK